MVSLSAGRVILKNNDIVVLVTSQRGQWAQHKTQGLVKSDTSILSLVPMLHHAQGETDHPVPKTNNSGTDILSHCVVKLGTEQVEILAPGQLSLEE